MGFRPVLRIMSSILTKITSTRLFLNNSRMTEELYNLFRFDQRREKRVMNRFNVYQCTFLCRSPPERYIKSGDMLLLFPKGGDGIAAGMQLTYWPHAARSRSI